MGSRWGGLEAEPGIVEALDRAGERPEAGNQNQKRAWSANFADGCAVAVATAFRNAKLPDLRDKRIRPESIETGTEPLTPLGSMSSKRIDVTIVDEVLGLEIGVSLKGLNFRDSYNGNFDKNLTGRLYELSDEVRLVHEHLPHAFMAGLFFLPLESVLDKVQGPSSFAHCVTKLKDRTGRLDPALSSHSARCDASYVALYVHDESVLLGTRRGACRFFPTDAVPPRRGRPIIESTLSLEAMILDIVNRATSRRQEEWSEPESDEPEE